MSIENDPDTFPWGRRVVSSSPHSEGARGAITGRGFSDLNVLIPRRLEHNRFWKSHHAL